MAVVSLGHGDVGDVVFCQGDAASFVTCDADGAGAFVGGESLTKVAEELVGVADVGAEDAKEALAFCAECFGGGEGAVEEVERAAVVAAKSVDGCGVEVKPHAFFVFAMAREDGAGAFGVVEGFCDGVKFDAQW